MSYQWCQRCLECWGPGWPVGWRQTADTPRCRYDRANWKVSPGTEAAGGLDGSDRNKEIQQAYIRTLEYKRTVHPISQHYCNFPLYKLKVIMSFYQSSLFNNLNLVDFEIAPIYQCVGINDGNLTNIKKAWSKIILNELVRMTQLWPSSETRIYMLVLII